MQLLHSLGIPLSIDNVSGSVEASAPSVLPGDVRNTHSTADPDISHTSALVPAKYSVAQSSFVQGTSSTGRTRSDKTQHHAAGFVTIGGTDALHKMQTCAVSSGENERQLLAGQRAQAVVPSTAQDYRKTAGSSGGGRFMQSSLGLASDRFVLATCIHVFKYYFYYFFYFVCVCFWLGIYLFMVLLSPFPFSFFPFSFSGVL